MTAPHADPGLKATLLALQQGEITENHIYKKLLLRTRIPTTVRCWSGLPASSSGIVRYGNSIPGRM